MDLRAADRSRGTPKRGVPESLGWVVRQKPINNVDRADTWQCCSEEKTFQVTVKNSDLEDSKIEHL